MRHTSSDDLLPMSFPAIQIDHPSWLPAFVDWDRPLHTDEERMRLAIELSRQNVVHGTGGPFGAVIVDSDTGRLVSVGVNSVVRLNNCTLHAEMVAFMMAQARIGCFTLRDGGRPRHELVTSCEPCAMCLGATLWSGVGRVVCGARGEDARQLDFDEGPVFPASHEYLETRGIEIVRDLLRDEAVAVLELYGAENGLIYNG